MEFYIVTIVFLIAVIIWQDRAAKSAYERVLNDLASASLNADYANVELSVLYAYLDIEPTDKFGVYEITAYSKPIERTEGDVIYRHNALEPMVKHVMREKGLIL